MTNIKRTELKPGQESVWDYPRPPKIENCSGHIKIIFNEEVIAETTRSKRVLETSHAPVYYIPPEDVKKQYLSPADNKTFCEWKGEASYCHLNVGGKQARYACWYTQALYMPLKSLRTIWLPMRRKWMPVTLMTNWSLLSRANTTAAGSQKILLVPLRVKKESNHWKLYFSISSANTGNRDSAI
jgi:uncharacterized protein (DUF427 family)